MKEKLYRISNLLLWCLLVLNLATFLGFVSTAQRNLVCTKVEISVNHGEREEPLQFVDNISINENLCDSLATATLPGQLLTSMLPARLEKILVANQFVKKAHVYHDVPGNLYVDVWQKQPVARVMAGGLDYYLTTDGGKMPVSNQFTCRVPVVSGCIFEGLQYTDSVISSPCKKILTFVNTIDSIPFWRAVVQQIHIDSSECISFYTSLGDQKVIVGNTYDLYEKLNRLKVFYQKVLNTRGWNRYNTIILKFKNQVVCTW